VKCFSCKQIEEVRWPEEEGLNLGKTLEKVLSLKKGLNPRKTLENPRRILLNRVRKVHSSSDSMLIFARDRRSNGTN
jgi:hypothetical protein